MERLAEGLQKLQEDDLLAVVQMVHDNKTPETYTKNDVEREFSFPFFPLGKWDTRIYSAQWQFRVGSLR